MSTYMAIVYIAEGIVYMATSYRDAGGGWVTRNQLKESGYQIQVMWQTGILLEAGDAESIKGIWRPDLGNEADW